MDSTSIVNLVTSLTNSFLGFFTNIYTSAHERKFNMNCCGCVASDDVVMNEKK